MCDNFLFFKGFLSAAHPGCLSRIPDLGCRMPDPGSNNNNQRGGGKFVNLTFLEPQDPGVKKAPDPGSELVQLNCVT
jgi:hypothetical protein